MNRNFKIIIYLLMSFIISCKKEAGEGGSSSISGKVYVKNYNANFTKLNKEYYSSNESVYIIYGNELSYGNNIKTSYDGVYEFKFLRKGNYKLFTYSKDSSLKSASGTIAVIAKIEIKDNNEIVKVPDLVIFK